MYGKIFNSVVKFEVSTWDTNTNLDCWTHQLLIFTLIYLFYTHVRTYTHNFKKVWFSHNMNIYWELYSPARDARPIQCAVYILTIMTVTMLKPIIFLLQQFTSLGKLFFPWTQRTKAAQRELSENGGILMWSARVQCTWAYIVCACVRVSVWLCQYGYQTLCPTNTYTKQMSTTTTGNYNHECSQWAC